MLTDEHTQRVLKLIVDVLRDANALPNGEPDPAWCVHISRRSFIEHLLIHPDDLDRALLDLVAGNVIGMIGDVYFLTKGSAKHLKRLEEIEIYEEAVNKSTPDKLDNSLDNSLDKLDSARNDWQDTGDVTDFTFFPDFAGEIVTNTRTQAHAGTHTHAHAYECFNILNSLNTSIPNYLDARLLKTPPKENFVLALPKLFAAKKQQQKPSGDGVAEQSVETTSPTPSSPLPKALLGGHVYDDADSTPTSGDEAAKIARNAPDDAVSRQDLLLKQVCDSPNGTPVQWVAGIGAYLSVRRNREATIEFLTGLGISEQAVTVAMSAVPDEPELALTELRKFQQRAVASAPMYEQFGDVRVTRWANETCALISREIMFEIDRVIAKAVLEQDEKKSTAEKNDARRAAEEQFTYMTGLKPPESDKTAGKMWWNPLREIAERGLWNTTFTRWIVRESVERMLRDSLTIKTPSSILAVATSLAIEATTRPRNLGVKAVMTQTGVRYPNDYSNGDVYTLTQSGVRKVVDSSQLPTAVLTPLVAS